jgi:hypothetical protein
VNIGREMEFTSATKMKRLIIRLVEVFDKFLIGFFVLNLILGVIIGDFTVIRVKYPCSVGVPYYCREHPYNLYWPPESVARAFLTHMYQNDPLGFSRPAWYMVTQYIGVTLWLPFYLIAIYAFLIRANWIRIPGIMWATSLCLFLIMIISEGLVGDYQRNEQMRSLVIENLLWLVLCPLALIRFLVTENLFNFWPILRVPNRQKKFV